MWSATVICVAGLLFTLISRLRSCKISVNIAKAEREKRKQAFVTMKFLLLLIGQWLSLSQVCESVCHWLYLYCEEGWIVSHSKSAGMGSVTQSVCGSIPVIEGTLHEAERGQPIRKSDLLPPSRSWCHFFLNHLTHSKWTTLPFSCGIMQENDSNFKPW